MASPALFLPGLTPALLQSGVTPLDGRTLIASHHHPNTINITIGGYASANPRPQYASVDRARATDGPGVLEGISCVKIRGRHFCADPPRDFGPKS